MENINDNIFENQNHKDFAAKVTNFWPNMAKAFVEIEEKYGIECLYDEETGDINICTEGAVNESQKLLDVKDYIKEHVDMDFCDKIVFA